MDEVVFLNLCHCYSMFIFQKGGRKPTDSSIKFRFMNQIFKTFVFVSKDNPLSHDPPTLYWFLLRASKTLDSNFMSWLFQFFCSYIPDYNLALRSQLHQKIFLNDIDLITVFHTLFIYLFYQIITWMNYH